MVALLVYYLKTRPVIYFGIFFLLAYWAILLIFGVKGDELSITGNAVRQLDNWLLGKNHLYSDGFDPEGLLSTIPALFNVIGGFVVGRFLQKNGKSYEGLTKLLLAGLALTFIAYCWNSSFPVNKKLWTSSYAVLTVGLDCLILAVIIYYTDFLGKTKGTHFFLVTGKNPLLIYLLSELGVTVMYMITIGNETLYGWLYTHIFVYSGEYLGAFLFAVSWMMTCWLVGYLLDRKKVYIRL
jgi:predicted acyltransferase